MGVLKAQWPLSTRAGRRPGPLACGAGAVRAGRDKYTAHPDIRNAVLFVASDEARYVTGLQFTVDARPTTKP